jgi:hypothetical protein
MKRKNYPTTFLLFLPLVLLFSLPAQAQLAKFYPYNEDATEPSFFIFKANLLEIIQKRDTAALMKMVSPGVESAFNSKAGIAEFKKVYGIGKPNTEIWKILTRMLSRGGAFNETKTFFTAPYTDDSRIPEAFFEPYEFGVIDAEDVKIYAKPDAKSKVLTKLSFDIVKVSKWYETSKPNWVTISLKGNTKGFVLEENILRPTNYHVTFQKEKGKWRIIALITG